MIGASVVLEMYRYDKICNRIDPSNKAYTLVPVPVYPPGFVGLILHILL